MRECPSSDHFIKNRIKDILNYIIVVAKVLFKVISLLIHYLWRFILALERNIRAKADTKENELPLISEDNSEVSVGEDKVDVSKVQDQFKKNTFPQQLAIPSTSEGTELRKRSVVNSADMGELCQICGVKCPTLRCQGPRCYKFFCYNCDALYHQHPRRGSHIRRDIAACIPIVKKPTLFEEAEKSFANKKQKISSEVVVKTICDLVSAEDETLDEGASSSTSWHCTFCTISNELSSTICKVCSKTNEKIMPLIETALDVLENESFKQAPKKTPTKFTKQSTNGENANLNNKLYDNYWKWFKDSSESNSQPPSENSSNFDVPKSSQTRSSRGRGNNIHPQNTAIQSRHENTSITPQEELNEEGVASGITKTSSETISPIDDIWKCTFCTFESDSIVNICQMCGKSNINMSVNKDNNTEMVESKNISKEGQRSDSATNANCNSDTDVAALKFMEVHDLDNYEIAKLASMLVNKNFRLQDAIEAAKNCSSFEESLAYLEQDCQMCEIKYSKRKMIKMLHCNHELCENCTRKYFTKQIRNNDITSFVCPFCKRPNQQRIETFDESISGYFSNLSILLKPILDPDELEMYQMKLRDWFLKRNPNFKQCPNCPFAGFVDDNQSSIECPSCNVTTCLQCKKIWYPNHEGRSCEQLTAWEEAPKSKKSNKKNEQQQEKNQDTKKGFFDMFKGSRKKPDRENGPEQINDSYSSAANYGWKSSQYPPLTQPQSQENTSTRPNHNPGNNASTGAITKTKNEHARSTNNAETRTMEYNATTRENFTVSQGKNVSEYISDIPATKWVCRNCTRINDPFEKICASCDKTYTRSFESNRVEDLQLASAQLENSTNVGGFNTNTHSEDLARVHNFNETNYDSKELASLIKDISITSDMPSTINATIGQFEMAAQTAMDWQQSHGHNSSTELYQKRGDEHAENWRLRTQAIMNGFSIGELEIAILSCNDLHPVEWLKNQWQRDIAYVKLTAARELSNFGDINFRNIAPVTDIQAKNALIKSFGTCTVAVRECVQDSVRKFKELQLMVPASITYNPTPTNDIIYSHQELRNAGTPNNTNNGSFIQSQFSRVDSAVERSANIFRQSVGFPTIQNPTAINNIIPAQYPNVNPSFGSSTRPDGVYLAKPAIADYKQNDTD